MPTKKSRVGFIPRSDVLHLINKLSYESNLSNSKIINILVEEALYKRGMFNIKTGKVFESINNKNFDIKNKAMNEIAYKEITYEIKNNFQKDNDLLIKGAKDNLLDEEIYEKFIMFLQFQEKIKRENKKI